MIRIARLLRLDRITVQIALVVFLGGIASAAAIGLFLVFLLPERTAPPEVRQVTTEITAVAGMLDFMSLEERERSAELYHRPDFSVTLEAGRAPPPASGHDLPLLATLTRSLPVGMSVAPSAAEAPFDVAFTVHLGDGQPVLFQTIMRPPVLLLSPLGSSAIVLGIIAVVLSVWAVLRIVTPMARFAAAVEQFGLRGEGDALPERGAAEVRKAANAFNLMRERIQRLIEDRTRTLVAISHDLRTPLTRLRLRAEEIGEESVKECMLRDMDLMEASIANAVSYLREGKAAEEVELVDLPSLIATICEHFENAGVPVTLEAPRRLAIQAQPQAIERAITNLVENGVKYASEVVVRLSLSGAQFAQVDVDDNGPGIPDAERRAVLQPFYRSRSTRDAAGGFGLGLAIVDDVARRHGGSLDLLDSPAGGLRARLRFPLPA